MNDEEFRFLQFVGSKKWIVFSPRRAKRPNVAHEVEKVCPFCPGNEPEEEEILRIIKPSESQVFGTSIHTMLDLNGNFSIKNRNDHSAIASSDWVVRVIKNKYPFASTHEIIVHSPDHHKNINELPELQVRLILEAYRERFNEHRSKGKVIIFHNHGIQAGESISHPHTQLVVLPFDMPLELIELNRRRLDVFTNEYFAVFSPEVAQWPDEVWIAPLQKDTQFGEVTDGMLDSLAKLLPQLIEILDLRHGHEFPFNYFIHPDKNWYIRIIPRQKILGGFELSTGIFVNTQSPQETNLFLKEHLTHLDRDKILQKHQAAYHKTV